MSAAFRLFLILMLVLTSQGLAAARGQPRALSELVICDGATVTTIAVDENGQPVKHTGFCPDMAPHLLAALSVDPPPALPRPMTITALRPEAPGLAAGRQAPLAQARDPPASRA